MKEGALILCIFGVFLSLAIFQDFQRAGTIALIANAASLFLGIFGGIAMGFSLVIGYALGKKKFKRRLIVFFIGFLGMLIPYAFIASLFGLMIEALNPPTTYDIGIPMMVFCVSLILCLIGSSGAAEYFVEKRWLAQGEEK